MNGGYCKLAGLLTGLFMLVGLAAGCGTDNSQTVRIGLAYELSGDAASSGTAAANGANLAFKEINSKGGVLGRQIEVIAADNIGDPTSAARHLTEMITQDKVIAVTGFTVGATCIAASGAAEEGKIPLVAAAAIDSGVTIDGKTGKVKDYIFRVCPAESFQGAVGAKFALKTLRARKGTVMVDSGSGSSKDMAQIFKEVFAKGGGSVITEKTYIEQEQDFTAVLNKIKDERTDMIYLAGYSGEFVKIVKQARELGINVPIVIACGRDLPKQDEIGGLAMNDVYFVANYSIDNSNPGSKAFADAYQKEYGQPPDSLAALGYDAAYVLVDAIKRAGSMEPDKILEALVATKNFPAITGSLTINTTHDAEKDGVIMVYRGGKMVWHSSVRMK